MGADLASGQAVERLLPYSAQELFDVAADVERYPEFLPGWIAASVRTRERGVESSVYYTDQVVGFGPVRVRFASRTVLRPPYRTDVASDDPSFRGFRLSWIFIAEPHGKCRVILRAVFEFRSRLLQSAAEHALGAVAADVLSAFEARARALYGRAVSSQRAEAASERRPAT